jgi:hypothetical protein
LWSEILLTEDPSFILDGGEDILASWRAVAPDAVEVLNRSKEASEASARSTDIESANPTHSYSQTPQGENCSDFNLKSESSGAARMMVMKVEL